jgi:hypothetical protein
VRVKKALISATLKDQMNQNLIFHLVIKTILVIALVITPTNLIRNQIIFKLIYPITLTRKLCPQDFPPMILRA